MDENYAATLAASPNPSPGLFALSAGVPRAVKGLGFTDLQGRPGPGAPETAESTADTSRPVQDKSVVQ